MEFMDRNPSQLNPQEFKWVEELARSEINMEESGVIDLDQHLDQRQLIEESAMGMLQELKDRFSVWVDYFNRCRSSSGSHATIKIYSISNTPADFMLYRNSLKLIVSHAELGVIRMAFTTHTGAAFAARTSITRPPEKEGHELIAQVGPFNEVFWVFQGQKVNLDSLVRHYLTEFIKATAR